MEEIKSNRSFWNRPEGKTGALFGIAILAGLGYAAYTFLPFIITLLSNTVTALILLGVLAVVVYVILDPRFRNLLWYMYKSIMRFITGLFVQIDPIGIIESYVESLRENLQKMGKQINLLRGQMRNLQNEITKNREMMESNMRLASYAKEKGKESIMVLKARKAGRLRDSNMKLEDLYKKMEVLYRVLCKMYENSEVLLEDIQDEVAVKKREREAIRASYSAMESARSIISGDKDRRAMFDQAMEAVAEDIGNKVGEMERFMEISQSFMDGIDLQNGVFEEKGLEMLEKWEKEGSSFLLGNQKDAIINASSSGSTTINLDTPISRNAGEQQTQTGSYGNLLDL